MNCIKNAWNKIKTYKKELAIGIGISVVACACYAAGKRVGIKSVPCYIPTGFMSCEEDRRRYLGWFAQAETVTGSAMSGLCDTKQTAVQSFSEALDELPNEPCHWILETVSKS